MIDHNAKIEEEMHQDIKTIIEEAIDNIIIFEKQILKERREKLEEQNKQLLDMIDAIPCTCDKIYKDRGLVAPDCPRCNYIDEDLIVTIENILKEGE